MIEAFAKCPDSGCWVHVWGPVGLANYCRRHGGNRSPEIDDDEYGIPRTASAADPSPAAPRPSMKAAHA